MLIIYLYRFGCRLHNLCMDKRAVFRKVLSRQEPKGSRRFFPPDIELTPSKIDEFNSMQSGKTVEEYFGLLHRDVRFHMTPTYTGDGTYLFSKQNIPTDLTIDAYGTGQSKGSAACMHMVHFHSPLTGECTEEGIIDYPLPVITEAAFHRVCREVNGIHSQGLAVRGCLEQTIWERAWLIRGMEDLMMDMMLDDPKAELLLQRICEHACSSASLLAETGVDLILLGDDIGMQRTPLMSPELWYRYLQPRLAEVIAAAKRVNPEILIYYHSCGYITPFIDGLIEAGVEILNPLQPESMDVEEMYSQYHDRVAFWGSIGTQTTMPFGTPEDVRKAVHDRVRISEDHRGFIIAPTHIIEHEVPWDNLHAYIDTMRELNGF